MDIVLFVTAFIGIVFISNCIHECGHAFAAKWSTYKNITISIGIGKRLFTFRLLQMNWHVHRIFFLGGHTSYEAPRTSSYRPLDIVWISLMGPLFNGILVFLLQISTDVYNDPLVYVLFLFNAWLICGNSVPIKWKEKASDGYIALEMIYAYMKSQKR